MMLRLLTSVSVCVCLALLMACPASAQKDKGKDKGKDKKQEEKRPSIWPDLKVGKSGYWIEGKLVGKDKAARWVALSLEPTVVSIIDGDTMVAKLAGKTFVVKGKPTKDLADGERLYLPGEWKVTGTMKRAESTLHVVEPKIGEAGKEKDKEKG
jgi:hypothetical protein